MNQRLALREAAHAALVEQAFRPEVETTGPTTSGSVCRVCRWDSAPEFPEAHTPACSLKREAWCTQGTTPYTTPVDDETVLDTDHANEPSETEEDKLKRIAVRTMRSARWGHEKARAWEDEVRPRSGRMPGGGGNGGPPVPARGNSPGIGGGNPASDGSGGGSGPGPGGSPPGGPGAGRGGSPRSGRRGSGR